MLSTLLSKLDTQLKTTNMEVKIKIIKSRSLKNQIITISSCSKDGNNEKLLFESKEKEIHNLKANYKYF